MSPKQTIIVGVPAVAYAALAYAVLVGPAAALSGAAPTPPAGQSPATAPGGTQGLAGPRNVEDAVRSGQAVTGPGGYSTRRSGARQHRPLRRGE